MAHQWEEAAIFDALQEQVGWKAPVEVLVIDHV
jgi:hypothetical protein